MQLPNREESPAWELINGLPQQKPMPTLHHSLLQKRLVNVVDGAASEYEAFPELRCQLLKNSVVPDVTIIHRRRLPVGNQPVQGSPDWLIEILSPEQSTTKLIAKIQTCIVQGSQLGWLIDTDEQVVMVFQGTQMQLVTGDGSLPVLSDIALTLTASELFGWLPSN